MLCMSTCMYLCRPIYLCTGVYMYIHVQSMNVCSPDRGASHGGQHRSSHNTDAIPRRWGLGARLLAINTSNRTLL